MSQRIQRPDRRSLRFESLETRNMKAAFMFQDGLAVVGTTGNDNVHVSVPTTGQHAGRMLVNVNGEQASFELSGFYGLYIVTGPGDDKITVDPSAVNNRGPQTMHFAGGKGNDTITSAMGGYFFGEAGDDVINADGTLVGDKGNDTLHGHGTLLGGKGNDTLQGSDSFDVLAGEAGDDVIYGYGGDDKIDGGVGNDEIHAGDGRDEIHGAAGKDTIYGDADYDQIWGEAGNDTLHGGATGDSLYGGAGNDSLYGDEGDDYILGEAGNDILNGGAGNDQLLAHAGNDQLFGDDGNDQLHGDKGADECHGGLGTDYLYGEAGNDALFGDADNDNLEGGLGLDKCFGGEGDDQLIGGREKDILDGGAGNNLSDVNNGNAIASNCLEADLDAECIAKLQWEEPYHSYMALDVQNVDGVVQYTLRLVVDAYPGINATCGVLVDGVKIGDVNIVGGQGLLEVSTDPNISPLGFTPDFPAVTTGVDVYVQSFLSGDFQKGYVV